MPTARAIAKRLASVVRRVAEHAGVHVLPVHYYSPVPSLRELRRTRATWARKSELPGIETSLEAQERSLRAVVAPFAAEYAGNAAFRHATAREFGPGYGYVEAQALHGVVRHFRPRRVVEVGSGVSTSCITAALAFNEREGAPPCRVTCVEPAPSPALRTLRGVEILAAPVQTAPMELFRELGERDLLFIDSTHTVKPGGDVNHLILEVLPRLRPGVVVHLHDIYLPYDHQPDATDALFHWTETSLLRAFLIGNARARILFCLSQLHHERPDALRAVFPEYRPRPLPDGLAAGGRGESELHFPSSIYIEIR